MQSKVSIIIPAHNSAATIEETLQSVLNQTFKDWEAIIVNDGSIDKTEEIISGYVKKDKRIRYVAKNKSGVSAARNYGIDKAVNEWLLFLDADDLIKPDMLEKMIKGTRLHPECDMILCNWERLTVDGKTIKEIGPNWAAVDAFDLFAVTCAFCIHSCLVKKSVVLKVGNFDKSLITCEDWDLWQRIARTGAKFTFISDYLAVYRMRSASASNKGIQLFKDGMSVVQRGHSKDSRVKEPDEKYINGTSTPDLQKAFNGLLTWSAGLMFGSGDDPLKLIEYFPIREKIFFDVSSFASDFFRAAMLPTGRSFEVWEELYDKKFKTLKSFLQKVEDLTSTPELVNRVLKSFESHFFYETDLSVPKVLGSTFGTSVDITQSINHIKTPAHIERVVIKVKAEEKVFGTIELPVIKGFVHKYVIKDAIAENYAWHILGEFFKENIYKRLGIIRSIGLKIRTKQYKQYIPKNEKYYQRLHDFIGWTVFLQETFDRPFWVSGRFYLPARQLKFVHTIVQENSPITVEIGKEIPNIKLKNREVIIIVTVGGNACRKINITSRKEFLNAQEIRSIIIKELGYELCKMIVREILLEEELKDHLSLRKRIRKKYQKAAKQFSFKKNYSNYDVTREIQKAAPDCEKGLIIPGRDSLFLDDSSARFALLPIHSINGYAGNSYISPEKNNFLPNNCMSSDKTDYEYVLYSPNIIVDKFETINGFNKSSAEKLNLKSSLVKTNWNTRDLPVLMYHRIAPFGSGLMNPYRITPAEFEKQLKYLCSEGYYSTTFEEWYAAVKLNIPLPGKAIILTFDDGYLDFYEYAFPLLSKYKFSAYVFIVTDYISRTNVWDIKLGEEVPLMSCEQIDELGRKGIKFGSHSAAHKPLTALSPEQLTRQFKNSLNVLRDQLGLQVNSIAYPYGDYDPVVKHLAGACGFTFALTCEEGKCNKFSELLALPRIDITGTDTLDTFIPKVKRLPIYPE